MERAGGTRGVGGARGRGGSAVGNIGTAPRDMIRATDSILLAASGAISKRLQRRDHKEQGQDDGVSTLTSQYGHAVEIEESMRVARALLCPIEGWKQCLTSLVTQRLPDNPLQYKFTDILRSMGFRVDGLTDEAETKLIKEEAEKMARLAGEITAIATKTVTSIKKGKNGTSNRLDDFRGALEDMSVHSQAIINRLKALSPEEKRQADMTCDDQWRIGTSSSSSSSSSSSNGNGYTLSCICDDLLATCWVTDSAEALGIDIEERVRSETKAAREGMEEPLKTEELTEYVGKYIPTVGSNKNT